MSCASPSRSPAVLHRGGGGGGGARADRPRDIPERVYLFVCALCELVSSCAEALFPPCSVTHSLGPNRWSGVRAANRGERRRARRPRRRVARPVSSTFAFLSCSPRQSALAVWGPPMYASQVVAPLQTDCARCPRQCVGVDAAAGAAAAPPLLSHTRTRVGAVTRLFSFSFLLFSSFADVSFRVWTTPRSAVALRLLAPLCFLSSFPHLPPLARGVLRGVG